MQNSARKSKPEFHILKLASRDAFAAGHLAELGRQTFTESFAHAYASNLAILERYLDSTFNEIKLSASITRPHNHYFMAYVDGYLAGYMKVKADCELPISFQCPVPSDQLEFGVHNLEFNQERGSRIRNQRTDEAIGSSIAKNSVNTGHRQLTTSNCLQLQKIYIKRDYQNLGLGGVMLEKCIEFAGGFSPALLWLAVYEHNPAARRFYERFGFKKAGEKIHHFEDLPINFDILTLEIK